MAGGTVTVQGAHNQSFDLLFDSNASLQLASALAGYISAAVFDGTIVPSNDKIIPLHGQTGEYVDTHTPLVNLHGTGFDAVVNVAKNATIFGSGGNGESVLSGASNLTFVATGGSGTIVAGSSTSSGGHQWVWQQGSTVNGGNDIVIPGKDNGNWLVETGGGNDTIDAKGGGNDTIGAGRGHNLITLGSGNVLVQSSGSDTIHAGSGSDTVEATKGSKALIYAGSGNLTYIGGAGASLTVIGGAAHHGRSGEHHFSGPGGSTLFGGGGDQFGHLTGQDTLRSGHGSFTTLGGSTQDTFTFSNMSLSKGDMTGTFGQGTGQITLEGFSPQAIASALQSKVSSGGSTTLTFSDGTQITFMDSATSQVKPS